jgi:hypothetical protein
MSKTQLNYDVDRTLDDARRIEEAKRKTEDEQFYLPPLPLLPGDARPWSEIRKEFYDLNDTEQMDASIADKNRRVGWPLYLCMTRRCTCPVHAQERAEVKK